MLYYYLKVAPSSPITLEIHDAKGTLVRRFSSEPPAPDKTIKNVPDYWFAPLAGIPKNAGLNRFVWDLHYDPPPTLQYSYYGNTVDYVEYTISGHAIAGDTPREQTQGPLAVPGEYQVVLTVGDQKLAQPLLLTLDPRLHVSQSDLDQQFATALKIEAGLKSSYRVFGELTALSKEITERKKNLESNAQAKEAAEAIKNVETQVNAIQSGAPASPGIGPINRDLARMAFMVESGDAAPSGAVQSVIQESCGGLTKHLAEWRALETHVLPVVNATLEKYKVALLPLASTGAVKTADDPPGDACQP
jgi:hypothetical protein